MRAEIPNLYLASGSDGFHHHIYAGQGSDLALGATAEPWCDGKLSRSWGTQRDAQAAG